jgi:hypothetical protein
LVKIIVSILLFISLAHSDLLDNKIKSFVGENRYYTQQKIINIILGDKTKYIKDDKIDVIKLLKVLKKNGFINLVLKKPQSVKITFKVQHDALLFLKVINDSLNSIGFNFYMTKEAVKNSDGFTWTIVMDTEYLIDPISLSKELKKRGCVIEDISKKNNLDWTYIVSMNKAKLLAKKIIPDVTYRLKKPIKPYWLSIPNDVEELFIQNYPLNRWHPYIIFYDKGLKILSTYQSDDKLSNLKLQIPLNTKYIMIDDKYTLSNIRLGLRVYISGNT